MRELSGKSPKNDSRQPIGLESAPTCEELGRILMAYGKRRLMSGSSNYVVTGFFIRSDGMLCTSALQVSHMPGTEVRQ